MALAYELDTTLESRTERAYSERHNMHARTFNPRSTHTQQHIPTATAINQQELATVSPQCYMHTF